MHRSVLTWWLAGWTLSAALAASQWDHLWATVALPILAISILPLVFLGFFLSGAVAGLWVPCLSVAVRAPVAGGAGAALHFLVLYVLGIGAHWPLASLAEPLGFAHKGQWVVMCTLAAAASIVVAVRARPSNPLPDWAAT